MLRRLWLTFAQAVTIGLALLFIVATLKPEWLRRASLPLPLPLPLTLPAADAGAAVVLAPPVASAPQAGGASGHADAVQRALPAVVSVYTTKEIRRRPTGDPLFDQFFGGRSPDRVGGLGSGVIVTADGYVLTNNHVVQAADEILVALSDGRRLAAKLVGTDPESDLAVLRVDAPGLPAIAFGRAEELRVGDVVLAIGNPFDVGQTVTAGIVSALGRNNLGINRYENFIQTDAAINQGNSGGALIDIQGNLVGINTAIYSRTGGSIGIGFAIPTSLVTEVMEQLIRSGKVVRGYFGIEPVDVTPELVEALKLSRSQGVLVRGVQRTAPAGRAGMEPGDIVLEINGAVVRNTPDLLAQIAKLPPGSSARVKLLRQDKEMEITVAVVERPTQP
jgi:Do/DeqQ family serine protease